MWNIECKRYNVTKENMIEAAFPLERNLITYMTPVIPSKSQKHSIYFTPERLENFFLNKFLSH